MSSILPPNLLSRLRSETGSEHNAVEQSLLLMSEDLTLQLYKRRLEQFYGFYLPVEKQLLDGHGPIAPWLAVRQRRKAQLLSEDLIALGQPADHRLPLCTNLPALHSAAECFGSLYVLEGATLGGVIINRYVEKKLGVTQDSGGKFFYGYGEQTGAMWQHFRAAITEFSLTSSEHDTVVASARATFKTLQQWCEKDQNP